MHKTIVAAAAVLLTRDSAQRTRSARPLGKSFRSICWPRVAACALIGAGVCLAQPPGITREMIERALPVEGAPLAEPGPYKITSEGAFGSPGYLVFRPATLDAFP